jgi:antitoxin (DNA-binding transcriptional repressor) of toxin-antitoxin stability system
MKTRATAKIPAAAESPATTKTRVTATEAARKFSEILNRVAYKGESFVVERGGRPICEISPAKKQGISTQELVQFLKTVPYPDKGYFKMLERITRDQPKVAPSPWDR